MNCVPRLPASYIKPCFPIKFWNQIHQSPLCAVSEAGALLPQPIHTETQSRQSFLPSCLGSSYDACRNKTVDTIPHLSSSGRQSQSFTLAQCKGCISVLKSLLKNWTSTLVMYNFWGSHCLKLDSILLFPPEFWVTRDLKQTHGGQTISLLVIKAGLEDIPCICCSDRFPVPHRDTGSTERLQTPPTHSAWMSVPIEATAWRSSGEHMLPARAAPQEGGWVEGLSELAGSSLKLYGEE